MARLFVALAAVWLSLLATPGAAASVEAKAPLWTQLSPTDQQVLAPLGQEWDHLPGLQRNRLLGVAKRYPGMTQKEQQRVQLQIKDWAKLTPAQRDLARKRYLKMKRLPAGKRQELKQKWAKSHKGQNQGTNPSPHVPAPGGSAEKSPAAAAPEPAPAPNP
jgi:hypothetical protein